MYPYVASNYKDVDALWLVNIIVPLLVGPCLSNCNCPLHSRQTTFWWSLYFKKLITSKGSSSSGVLLLWLLRRCCPPIFSGAPADVISLNLAVQNWMTGRRFHCLYVCHCMRSGMSSLFLQILLTVRKHRYWILRSHAVKTEKGGSLPLPPKIELKNCNLKNKTEYSRAKLGSPLPPALFLFLCP